MSAVLSGDFLPVTLALLENLYDSDHGKDVELVASDGAIWAHSCILRAAAEPLSAMLTSCMAEGQTKRIEMPDFKVHELKFILRLLCTGGVHPAEWPAEKILIKLEAHGEDGIIHQDFSMLSTTKYEKLMKAWCEHHGIPLSEAVFEMKGRKISPTDTPLKLGLMHAHKINAYPADSVVDSQSSDMQVSLRPPLKLLFASASFAKRYGMDVLLSAIIQCLKSRICEEDFETIMSLAIQVDITPVKLACLLFAREHENIKKKYDGKTFAPCVQFELEALWSPQPAKKCKFTQALKKVYIGGNLD